MPSYTDSVSHGAVLRDQLQRNFQKSPLLGQQQQQQVNEGPQMPTSSNLGVPGRTIAQNHYTKGHSSENANLNLAAPNLSPLSQCNNGQSQSAAQSQNLISVPTPGGPVQLMAPNPSKATLNISSSTRTLQNSSSGLLAGPMVNQGSSFNQGSVVSPGDGSQGQGQNPGVMRKESSHSNQSGTSHLLYRKDSKDSQISGIALLLHILSSS